ncbi:hypothetical protein E4T52_03891 [Aureobasidium sp. EXF-3400]|nr:hypothetical protein E4T51_12949 [Aureobasidium sp. EXF-12344]KAI4781141.1 hypothetical protein E4T52_03891 [Aureobasidium sp. EXF-3400]
MPASTTYMLRDSVLPSLKSPTPIAQSVEPSAKHPQAEYPTYSIGGGYPQWVPSRASDSPGDQLLSSTIVSLSTDAETWSNPSSPDLDSPPTSMVVTTLATDGTMLTVPTSATFMSTADTPNAAPSRWTSSELFETTMSFTVSGDVEKTTDAVVASSLLPTQEEDIRRTVVMSSSTTGNLEESLETPTSSASYEDNAAAGSIGFENITSTSTVYTQYGIANGSEMPDNLTVWYLTSSSAHSTASKNIETVGASNSTGWKRIRPSTQSDVSTQIVISSETSIPRDSSTNEVRSDSSTWSESSSLDNRLTTTSDSQSTLPTNVSIVRDHRDTMTFASSDGPHASETLTPTSFASVTRYNQDYWSVTSNDLVDTTPMRDGIDSTSSELAMERYSSSTDESSASSISSVTTIKRSNFTTQATNAPNASLTMFRSKTEFPVTMATPDFALSSYQNVSNAGTPIYSTRSGPNSYIESLATATALNSSGSLTMSATRVSQPEPVSSVTSSTSKILLSTITESDLSSVSSDEASAEVSPLTYYKPADVLATPTSSSNAVTPMTDAPFTASSTLAAESVTTGSSADSIRSDQSSVLSSQTTLSSVDDISVPTSTDAPDDDGSMSLPPQYTSASGLSSTEEFRTQASESSASNEPSSLPDSPAEVTDVLSTSPTTSEPASGPTGNSTVYPNVTYSAVLTGNHFADTSTEEAGSSSSTAELSSTSSTDRASLQRSVLSTPESITSSFVLGEATSTSVKTETRSVSALPNKSSYDPSTPSNTRDEPPTTTSNSIASTGDVVITSSSEDEVLSSSTSPTASGRYYLTGNMQNSSSSEPFRSDSSSESYVDAYPSSTSDLSSTYYATTTSSDSLDEASSSASAIESVYWSSPSAITLVTESSSYRSSYSLGVCQTGAASDLSSYSSASKLCSSFMAPPSVTSTTTVYSTQTTATTSLTTSTQTVRTETSQRVVTRYYSDSTVTTTTCVPASNSGNNFRKRDASVTSTLYSTLLQRRDDASLSPTVSTECSAVPSVLSGYSCDEVSSACSCNGISTISQTPTSTITVVSSVQQTDVIVQTTTESVTVTILSSSTSYIPQTSTVLYCPRPSSDCGNKGYSFAYYGNEPYGNSVVNMDATYTKKMTPNYNSTTNLGVGLYGSEWASVSLYGSSQTYSDNYFYLAHKGYFYAQVTGNYNFTIKDADDVAYVWMGEAAYMGWTGGPDGGNYVAKARCCWPPENTNTTTYYMEAETYVPFRIVLGQQDGGTSLGLTITAPDGTVILETGKESDYVVQYSCDGTAPPFPDWGYET